MKTAIRKMGNSHGVIIPKPLLAELGAKPNDQVDMGVENGRIIISPIRKRPRAGWAEASKRLAAAGEGGVVWPEFGSDADQDLKWRTAARYGSPASIRRREANSQNPAMPHRFSS